MKINCLFAIAAVLVPISVTASARGVEFTAKPVVGVEGKRVKIEFGVSENTDVTVEIVSGTTGKVVRHLASGVLGKNPPAPLVADSLKQKLFWDRLDDDGKPVAAKCKVRVGLGLQARLDRIYGWDQSYAHGSAHVAGMAVTPSGEVIMQMGGARGYFRIVAFSREGKYLRTIYPYRGDLPEEKVKGFGRLKQKDGTFLPLVHQGHHGVLLPEVHNPDRQTMAISPQGWLVFPNTPANKDWYGVQTDRRRVLIMGLDGSCPRKTFFGPTILEKLKYGEAHLAVSPDGKTVYASGFGDKDRPDHPRLNKPLHAVYRGTLDGTGKCSVLIGDPAKPGSDDFHFKGPAGLAVDAKGNLYVADTGNNRVMAFGPSGKKLLGKCSVEAPDQLQINRKTGELYVLGFPRNHKTMTVTKIGPLADFRVLTSGIFKRYNKVAPIFALDSGSKSVTLWFARLGYQDNGVRAMEDRDGKLAFVDKAKRSIGYRHPTRRLLPPRHRGPMTWPGYLEVSPDEKFLYAGCARWNRVDLETGEIKPSKINANNITIGPDGHIYGYGRGWIDNTVWKFDANEKRVAFPGGAMSFKGGKNEFRGPTIGGRGLQVDRKGNIYLYEVFDRMKLKNGTRLAKYSPAGKPLNKELVLAPVSAGGFQVDRKGNIYVICNVRPRGVVYPEVFAKQEVLPDPMSLRRPWQWPHAYLNYYLFHIGSVFKFGPEGGSILVNWSDHNVKAVPEGKLDGGPVPARQVSGIYYHSAKVKGAKMQYFGTSPTSSPAKSGGDPWCMCFSPRFSVDDHGRVFLPDTMRFQVAVTDANGNEMLRFGKYGNADEQGPEITFQYFMYVTKVNDSVYVSDYGNQRIVRARLGFRKQAECPLP